MQDTGGSCEESETIENTEHRGKGCPDSTRADSRGTAHIFAVREMDGGDVKEEDTDRRERGRKDETINDEKVVRYNMIIMCVKTML
jgi:hypothetical protein